MSDSSPSLYVPFYYPQFQCIADKCSHTCCVGWEIDVDPDSLANYERVVGPLGEKLAHCIKREEDGTAHFILEGEEERCPFLNEKNLCELYIGLGEASLCKICTDHPRFRNYFSKHVEMGLGLCCESAARLVLSQQEPIRIVSFDAEKELAPVDSDDMEEAYYLNLRARLFETIADDSLTLDECLDSICESIGSSMPEIDPIDWAKFLLTLERLDEAWEKKLNHFISLNLDELESEQASFRALMQKENRTSEYNRLLEYLLFRHLNGALHDPDDDALRARILFATITTSFMEWLGIAHYAETNGFKLAHQVDLVRMFSSEIEYSDENVTLILDEIARRYL